MGKGKGVWTACYLDLFDCEKTAIAAGILEDSADVPAELHAALPLLVPAWVLRLNLTLLNRLSTDGVFRVRTYQGVLATIWPDYDAGSGTSAQKMAALILDSLVQARFLEHTAPDHYRIHEYELHNSRLLKDRARKIRRDSTATGTATATATSSSTKKTPRGIRRVEALPVAQYLADAIMEFDPNKKITPRNVESWARDIDRAFRIDKRDPLELEQVIDFVYRSPDCWEKWKLNIRSGLKLRKHAEKILDAMNAGPQHSPRRRTAAQGVAQTLRELDAEGEL